jgi:hypothetical protein
MFLYLLAESAAEGAASDGVEVLVGALRLREVFRAGNQRVLDAAPLAVAVLVRSTYKRKKKEERKENTNN